MSTAHWYRALDLLPPYNSRVRLHFSGRVIEGARGRAKGRDIWLEFPRGEEPRRIRVPAAFLLWQPLDSATWTLDLPRPVTSPEPRMVWTGQRFSEVDAEERAEDAKVASRGADHRWWWTPDEPIRYAPAGAVTQRMAEGRLMRAVTHCGRGQGLTLRAKTPLSVLADLADAAHGVTTQSSERFTQSAADISDFDEAMRWFLDLGDAEDQRRRKGRKAWDFSDPQKLLFWRAMPRPVSWIDIGRMLAIGAKGSRQLYADSIAVCWRRANSVTAPPKDAAHNAEHRGGRKGPSQ